MPACVDNRKHASYTLWLLFESLLVTVFLLASIAWLREQALVWLPVVLLGFWLQRLYMVGHEASHRKLWPRSLRLNDFLGQLFLLPMLVPLSVFRQIHFFHHGHNRRDLRTSALDVYLISKKFPRLQRCWSYLLWYVAVFGGGFFLHSLISILILLVIPPRLARRISPAFRGWTWRKQLHALAIFGVCLALHVAVGLTFGSKAWLYFCGFPLLCFAWIYSALMYIYHYRTPIGKQVGDNARSVRWQFLSAWWLLNFNEHRVHHHNPSIPWYLLPANRHLPRATKEPTLSLLQAVLQQLCGPTLIKEGNKMQDNVPRCLVRTATLSDVDNIITIKQALRPVDGERGGGFILGSARELYCAWIKTAVVKVLQNDRESGMESCEANRAASLVGYAICLPDAMLRQSELWQKKDRISFSIPIDSIMNEKIAYFEQLAVLPRYRYYLPQLLIETLDVVFAQGHQHLFATTVCEPASNYATQGLFKRSAAQTVGYLREHYPEYGTIVSQLHYLQQQDYQRARAAWCLRSVRNVG